MISCFVEGCRSESYAGCGISFHRFPKDETLRAKWLGALGVETASKRAVICSRHFKKEHYRPTTLPTLTNDAVPYIVDSDSFSNWKHYLKELEASPDSPPDDLRETSPISPPNSPRPTASEDRRKKPKLQTELSVEFTWNQPSATVPDVSDLPTTSERDYLGITHQSGIRNQNGFLCNICRNSITGFRYVCVQCADYDLCPACEAGGAHAGCYVLRAPPRSPEWEVQELVQKIRLFITTIEVKSERVNDINEDPLDNYATEDAIEEKVLDQSMTDFSIVKTEEDDFTGNQVHVVQDGLSNLLAKKSADELLDTPSLEPTLTQPAKKVRTQFTSPTSNVSVMFNRVTNPSTKLVNPTKVVNAPTKVAKEPIKVKTAPSIVIEPTECVNTPTKVINIPTKVINVPTKVINTSTKVINVPTKVINAPTNVINTSKEISDTKTTVTVPSQVKSRTKELLRVETNILKKYLQSTSRSDPVVSSRSAASGNVNTSGTLATSAQQPGSSREVTDSSYTPKMFIQIDSGTISLPGAVAADSEQPMEEEASMAQPVSLRPRPRRKENTPSNPTDPVLEDAVMEP